MSEPVLPVEGIRLSAVPAGIRYQDRDDLVLIELAAGSHCAGVFTRNRFCAAPVKIAQTHLQSHDITQPMYWLINAGNANAGTGMLGEQAALLSCQVLAEQMGVHVKAVLPFSTGVIGELLPVDKLVKALPQSIAGLQSNQWQAAAKGIMTTDLTEKTVSRQCVMQGKTLTLTGIAKGSGMIHPDMATMLAFVATDAAIEPAFLQEILSEVAEETFNCITVDGDTSTNDALMLAATGASKITINEQNSADFRRALQEVCLFLAKAIVRDGEGATKLVGVHVTGADSRQQAKSVANTVALSPLVKTALFASDPNWGRILAAIGRSPVEHLAIEKVTIHIGDVLLVEQGEPAASYQEEQGQNEFNKPEIDISIDLGMGNQKVTVWTCDFSYDYVKINAEYRS